MRAAWIALACVAACGPSDSDVDSATPSEPTPIGLADQILWAPGASDAPFRDATRAVNGVHGSGPTQGSTDVYSLARDGDEAGLAISWSGGPVVDGPGPDLVVYENPFAHPAGLFMDPVVVEVSVDGDTWIAFPHDYLADDERVWSDDPSSWQGFAGLTPVLLNDDTNPSDPLDPAVSGGDGFDLAALDGVSEICCVRLWSASEWINPDTGEPFVRHPIGDGADIDGVYGRTVAD